MLDSLKIIFHQLIAAQQMRTFRYLFDQFTLTDRLIGLIGPRGVGKTTFLLQIIKQHFPDLKEVFYFSADHLYFNTHNLYQFMESLYRHEGISTFFVDEIHKYPNWDQELKNLYDGFPTIRIIFSGSSSLDLVKGSYDLSRRARLYHLSGLSFREYLFFKKNILLNPIKFEDLLKNPLNYNTILPTIPQLGVEFKNYLVNGYYPFFLEGTDPYYEKILRIIDKTIYEDIATFYKLKTQNLLYFKKIVNYLSAIEPGTFSLHNLAKNLSIDDKTAANYLSILEDTQLIRMVYPYAKGNQILRKPEKVFLNNTTLGTAIHSTLGGSPSRGLLRELFFLQSLDNTNNPIFYHTIGDYRTQEYGFEIGGKNKTNKQVRHSDLPVFLIKDDIEFATKKEIPIYLLGLLY